jgi:hypothetical protein
MAEMEVYIAIAAFLVNFIGQIILLTWKLGQVQLNLTEKISAARMEIEEKQDTHVRQFGETIAAIRQKVADVELYSANNYIRREGFYKVQEKLTDDITALGNKIEARLLRMETKLDSKT